MKLKFNKMGWRFRKRLFYISFIILIILIIFGPKLYKIIFYPSCYNNRQDPNEEGIDCGGPCIPCSVKELKDIIIQTPEPTILVYPDETMDLIGIIKNPNENYGLKYIEYKFILYGGNREKFEKEGKTYILPLESKYIIESGLQVPQFEIIKKEFKVFYKKEDWQKLETELPKITLLNYEIKDKEFDAEIINENLIDYPSVGLIFIFKDEYEEILGTFKTIAYDLKAGERRKISYYNLPPLLGKPYKVILYPEVNIFEL